MMRMKDRYNIIALYGYILHTHVLYVGYGWRMKYTHASIYDRVNRLPGRRYKVSYPAVHRMGEVL